MREAPVSLLKKSRMIDSRCQAGNEQGDSATSCHITKQGSYERLPGPVGRGPGVRSTSAPGRTRGGRGAGRRRTPSPVKTSWGLRPGPCCARTPRSHTPVLCDRDRRLPPGRCIRRKFPSLWRGNRASQSAGRPTSGMSS